MQIFNTELGWQRFRKCSHVTYFINDETIVSRPGEDLQRIR